jgi:predicted TIM-barrel fold metal-dependent hydrolase
MAAQYLTQPPDPQPKAPAFAVPQGACDCHFHLFGPAPLYRFDPASPYYSNDALPETFFAMQARLGFARGVLISGGGYGRDTTHLTDTLARFPERLRGIAWAAEDIDTGHIRRLDTLGVRGIRFISERRRGGLPVISAAVAQRVYDAAGWQVHFYPEGDLAQQAARLLALPNTIVLDHFASLDAARGVNQPEFTLLLELLDTGRVWVKLSGPMRCTREEFPYAPLTPIARALVAHAPQRLIWGSDWPHVNMNDRQMPNDGDLVDLLAEWIPDPATRRRILVDNPALLFGF